MEKSPFRCNLLASAVTIVVITAILTFPCRAWSFSSANIPLDSPIYSFLTKLSGFGLIETDVAGLRPFPKAEAARLVVEAEGKLATLDVQGAALAGDLLSQLNRMLAREIALAKGGRVPAFAFDDRLGARARFVFLDGVPRSYDRDVYDPMNQSAFGFIGGNLRPQAPIIIGRTGTEGTPLSENNEGVNYRRGANLELSAAPAVYLSDWSMLLAEPDVIVGPADVSVSLRKGYLKFGGGGAELEVGRDANWFGPGYRGALTLTNNARNFDQVKLSSPEPVDVPWIKRNLGQLKYAFVFSRFDRSGSGEDLREPYFIGSKVALRVNSWFEIGGNLVRQEGGPNLKQSGGGLQDILFGGSEENRSNSIAGIDLRFRVPQLRNAEIYGEYVGEDSASFWPFVESYLFGIYLPRLTASGRDDLRVECLWAHQILYTDYKFPAGYTFNDMTPGHSQGGGTRELFLRYSHWFEARNTLAAEYFYTERGHVGRVAGQAVEEKHALRGFYNMALANDVDLGVMYGFERIRNFDLVHGAERSNQLLRLDLRYQY